MGGLMTTKTLPLTTYYLEMLRPDALRPKEAPEHFEIRRVELPCPEYNRFLYATVGWPWSWVDKLGWSFEQWRAHVSRPEFGTWVGYMSGTPAGYYELEQQPEGNVEIVYFGLLPDFTGRGLGGALLTSAITSAWQWGAKRVWVHTCSLDHPAALRNYQARGMQIYRTEESTKTVPATPRRDWEPRS